MYPVRRNSASKRSGKSNISVVRAAAAVTGGKSPHPKNIYAQCLKKLSRSRTMHNTIRMLQNQWKHGNKKKVKRIDYQLL